MILPSDKPETTIVYSKNNCPKCMMTKKQLTTKGVEFEEINIETSGEFEAYVEFLKGDKSAMSMPVVYPAQSTGVEPWNDFRPDKIAELASK